MPANPQVTEQMVEKAAEAIYLSPAPGDPYVTPWSDLREKDKDAFRQNARAALTAALADHVVVHRSDVTYDMFEAGISALASDDARSSSVLVCDIYRAMLSAAPLPQKEG